MIISSAAEAQDILRNYVCSACWGVLYSRLEKDEAGAVIGERILCVDCEEAVLGFVSNSYILRRLDENSIQYELARHALREAIPWMTPPVDRSSGREAALIKELGF